MTTKDLDQIRDEQYRIITIVRDWRMHTRCGEEDTAWRYIEGHVLPAHQNVHLECLIKSTSPWDCNCTMIRDLTRHIRSDHWDLVVVDTIVTLSRAAAVTWRLIQEICDRNVRFVAVIDGIDTSRDWPPIGSEFQ